MKIALALFLPLTAAVQPNTYPQPTFYRETGFDFVGNDIAPGYGPSVEYCAYNCFYGVTDCKAFSWTKWNGGTCYYKNGRGTVKVNPDVVSGVVFAPGPVKLYPSNGIDYEGNDLTSAPSAHYNGCTQICQNTLGCRAFTWSGYNGGTCWLKKQKGNSYVSPNAISMEIFPQNSDGTCALERDMDYVGNDLGSVPAAKPEDCCSICSGYRGCVAYSWSGGTCYLKNRKDEVVYKEGVVSATMRGNPYPYSCAMEQRTDFIGNDIGSVKSADKFGCCSLCMQTDACGAFSWKSGTCYLKSKKGDTRVDNDVFSAVV